MTLPSYRDEHFVQRSEWSERPHNCSTLKSCESKIHNCDERFEPLLKNDALFFSQLLEVEEL
jgi:hypothetical protein